MSKQCPCEQAPLLSRSRSATEERLDLGIDGFAKLDISLDLKSVVIEEDFGCNDVSGVSDQNRIDQIHKQDAMARLDNSASLSQVKALDLDVALEAACGDYEFLVL